MPRCFPSQKRPNVSAWDNIIQRDLERAAIRQLVRGRQLKAQKKSALPWVMLIWYSLLLVWVGEQGQVVLLLSRQLPKNWARSPLVLSPCHLRLKAHGAGA